MSRKRTPKSSKPQTCSMCGEAGHNARRHRADSATKARAAATVAIVDGWESNLTGLGDASFDKRQSTTHCTVVVDSETGRDLYRGDDIAARIVDMLPDQAFRQGYEIQVSAEDDDEKPRSKTKKDAEDNEELKRIVGKEWKRLGLTSELKLAAKHERWGGGAAILIGTDDNSSAQEELDEKRVRNITHLTAFETLEIWPVAWYENPFEPKFGQPRFFQVNTVGVAGGFGIVSTSALETRRAIKQAGSVEKALENNAVDAHRIVHESRLLVFPGINTSRRSQFENGGWGDNVFTRIYAVIRDFQAGFAAVGVMLNDFSQSIWKVKDLANLVANDKDGGFKARLAAMELARSIMRAVVVEAEGEEFERKATPVAGLADLIDRFSQRLAAAAQVPVTWLMGTSPAGMNATGESDLRNFYDTVAVYQQEKLLEHIERITRIIMVANDLAEPDEWSIVFRPLWQPTDLEVAEARNKQADTDKKMIDSQVLSPEDVARSRYSGDEYSFETTVDLDAMREQREANEAAEEAQANAQAEALKLAAQQQPVVPGNKPKPPGVKPNDKP